MVREDNNTHVHHKKGNPGLLQKHEVLKWKSHVNISIATGQYFNRASSVYGRRYIYKVDLLHAPHPEMEIWTCTHWHWRICPKLGVLVIWWKSTCFLSISLWSISSHCVCSSLDIFVKSKVNTQFAHIEYKPDVRFAWEYIRVYQISRNMQHYHLTSVLSFDVHNTTRTW